VREPFNEPPTLTPTSGTGVNLLSLPPPDRPIDIAIYSFPDFTGKNEPNDNFAQYSRAVTQGGVGFAIDALQRAGGGKWFSVVERTGLTNLLQERQLIRATREQFEGPKAKPLPPLRFAGIIIEGGILAYDANFITGGVGAKFLGTGGDVKYRRDVVTVGIRAVSVQNGEVLRSITTTKTIYSVALDASAYRFVAVDRILEAEAGITRNEPTQLAVREAIELAVYSLIIEGADHGLWHFKDRAVGRRLIDLYKQAEKPIDVQVASLSNLPKPAPAPVPVTVEPPVGLASGRPN
jgi:curli production assembly/transport component CsgG